MNQVGVPQQPSGERIWHFTAEAQATPWCRFEVGSLAWNPLYASGTATKKKKKKKKKNKIKGKECQV